MLTIFMAIAAAYFVGLGAMGFLFVLGLLQIQREHGKLSGPVMAILSGLNLCLAMGGIFVGVIMYREYDKNMNDEMRWAYVVTGFVMLGLLFVVAKEWNRLLLKEKRDVDSV